MIRKYDQDDWITLVIRVEIVLGEDCAMIRKYDQDDRITLVIQVEIVR